MSLIRLNHQPNRQQLRIFAFAWLVCFGSLAGSAWFKGNVQSAACLIGVATLVPFVGLLIPRLLRLIYLGTSYLTFPIGWVISHVILALVYYILLTPIGLMLRLFRRDPMDRRFDRTASTYWKKRGQPSPPESYFQQH